MLRVASGKHSGRSELASLAQLVEHLLRKQGVSGSNPERSSISFISRKNLLSLSNVPVILSNSFVRHSEQSEESRVAR